MAVAASKLSLGRLLCGSLDFSCYEIGHTWSPICSHAILMFTSAVVKQSFKIYLAFYLANFILRKEKLTKGSLRKLAISILQSTCFLGVTAFMHLFSTCAIRHALGKFYLVNAALIPGFICGITGICVERESRRSALALYVANVATETIFRMLVTRNIIRSIPNGEKMRIKRCIGKIPKVSSIMTRCRFLFGKPKVSTASEKTDTCYNHTNNGYIQRHNSPPMELIKWIKAFWKSRLTQFQSLPSHASCDHQHSCFYSSFSGFLKSFSVGYVVNSALTVAPNVQTYATSPRSLVKQLLSRRNMNLGLFLGGFTGVYKTVSCLLRWYGNKDESWHALPAGFLAGTTMYFFKSSTLALYVAWKVVEIYYRSGIEAGHLPVVPGFIKLLYALSCAILFHCAVVEPHNVKPTYYKFLVRVTCGLIDKVNRVLMNEFIEGSSRMNPNFIPVLDKRYMTPSGIEYMKTKFPDF